MRFQIQGYALPWDKPAYVDGVEETCAPRAVAPDTPRNLTLLYGSHDEDRRIFANTRNADRSLKLFADDYGLGFTAWLDSDIDAHFAAHRALARGHITQCSVNFINMRRLDTGRIIWAQIDHIAIVAEGAYADTGVWLADQPWNTLQPWLRDMRNRFANTIIEHGRAAPRLVSAVAQPVAGDERIVASEGNGAKGGRGFRPAPSRLPSRTYAAAILARVRQLGLPTSGAAIGMPAAHLLDRLNAMAAECGP